MPELLLRTSWSNHLAILNRCSTIDQQIFYILYAEYEHLKFKELERAIKTDAYSRILSDKKFQSQMLKAVYPKAEVLLKDGAILDMLGLPRKYKETTLRQDKLELEVENLRNYVEDILRDQNDTNEIVGAQMEAINESLAELAVKVDGLTQKKQTPRNQIGFAAPHPRCGTDGSFIKVES